MSVFARNEQSCTNRPASRSSRRRPYRGGNLCAAGSSRQGADSARTKRPDQRRVRGRGHVCRAARQVVWSGGDGVCSTRNVDTIRSIGADHVIDYTEEDFTRSGHRYDLMLDIAGSRSWSDCSRVLGEKATLVVVGGPKGNRWIGPLSQALKLRLGSVGNSRRVVAPFLAKINKAGSRRPARASRSRNDHSGHRQAVQVERARRKRSGISARDTPEGRSSSTSSPTTESDFRQRRPRESCVCDRISRSLRRAVAGDRSQEVVSLEGIELGVDDCLHRRRSRDVA